jgi:hypothetical protein
MKRAVVLRVIRRIGVLAAKNMKDLIDPSGPLPKPKRRYKARAKKLVLGDGLLRQLTALAQLQCTQKEAARVLRVSHRLLVQFLADHAEARQAWDRGRSLGHVSLRRLLWRQAQHNPAQARFLGKHWLDMDGKPRHHTTEDAPPVLSDEENTARIHELLAEARRGSNRTTDHKLPDSAASTIPPGDLSGDLSDVLKDLQLPDDLLDSLDHCDWDLSEAIQDLQLPDDLLGALDLFGSEDPGDSTA